jgi:uncharacterized protein YihD (DUF1040 family)
LQYYKENKWKSAYISQVKVNVVEIWNNIYKNSNLDIELSDNADDDILLYVFKKNKELEMMNLLHTLKNQLYLIKLIFYYGGR